MWTQIVGKVRLAQMPFINHWWNVPLYVTPRGLTTGAMPHGEKQFAITFDLINHALVIDTSDGRSSRWPLEPMSVADFYKRLMATLAALDLPVGIWPMPVEVPGPVAFTSQTEPGAYDPIAIRRLHQILLQSDRLLHRFRSRFTGKCSPVHFFWGAFDLAVTRFSGRTNPNPPGDSIGGPAYSHEVISHGFWPGGDWPMGGRVESPVYYAYAVPEPAGFREVAIMPQQAYYDEALGEFILPYDVVRTAADPDATLLEFMQSTYEAGARLADWPVDGFGRYREAG
jgi:hypothetical protein